MRQKRTIDIGVVMITRIIFLNVETRIPDLETLRLVRKLELRIDASSINELLQW